jgi:MraZ protein
LAFRGTYDYSLDAKNRLTVPARFRSALSDGVVLAKRVAGCVAVWRPDDYDAYMQAALERFHPMSPEAEQLERFFSANSHDTELDAAGRIGIPPFLLAHAGLGKDVVVTGAGRCLEIWDRGAWNDYNDRLTQSVADITSRLGDAG